jgi:L-aspartate oxidase
VVASALAQAITSGSRVELHENEFVVDLLVDAGRCVGAISLDREGEPTVTLARAVVLACGGAGQVFAHTTNPLVATGDGRPWPAERAPWCGTWSLQFHPTALYATENPTFLLTEALRGEGAYLRDDGGERLMVGSHPRAELAPRDVVVRRIKRVFDRDDTDHVWLDARHLDCAFLRERFPTVYNGLQARDRPLHPVDPIAPARITSSAEALTDTWGRTTIPGLYACGETAAPASTGRTAATSTPCSRASCSATVPSGSWTGIFRYRSGGEEGETGSGRRAP